MGENEEGPLASSLVDRVAREISLAMGYDFDTLYDGKAEWIEDRGSRHDINTPYKPDMLDAAERAIVEASKDVGWITEAFQALPPK